MNLTVENLADIEARDWHLNGALEKRIALSPAERDALCATVRHLLSENEKLRERILELETDIDTKRGYL